MSTFPNGHQDWEVYDLLHALSPASTASSLFPKIVTTFALLILGYYVLNFFSLWPDTIQRALYEIAIYLVPSPAIYALQAIMQRYSGPFAEDEPTFKRSDFGNTQAKIEAIKGLYRRTPLRAAVRKARSRSGLDALSSASKELGPPGLGNWDNSCYQNSIMQGLGSLPAFQEYITNSLRLCHDLGIPAATHAALDSLLQQLSDVSAIQGTIWTPHILKSMDSWQQQDAQEYFTRIVDSVEKEDAKFIEMLKKRSRVGLKRADKDSAVDGAELVPPVSLEEGSIFPSSLYASTFSREDQHLFASIPRTPMDGWTAQAVECLTCGFSEGYTLTQFNCLTLNLGERSVSRLEDLIEEYTNDEHIDGVECTECTKALAATIGQKQESTDDDMPSPAKRTKLKPVHRTKAKQITVARLPKNLVFHLNRSYLNQYGEQMKNYASIRFPARLHFLSRWCTPLDTHDAPNQRTYELRCCVTHHGRHDNGHYVATGKRDKDWYCFNDDLVSKTNETDVLNQGNVFMLFYEALDTPLVLAQNEPAVVAAPPTENEVIAAVAGPRVVDEPADGNPAVTAITQIQPEVINANPVVESSGTESNTSGSESDPPVDEEPARPVISVPVLRTASGSTCSRSSREKSPAVPAV